MAERNKVMKGLECCSQSDIYSRKSCKECPYNYGWRDDQGIAHWCQITQLRKDALSLLKAQEQEISRLKNHVEKSDDDKCGNGSKTRLQARMEQEKQRQS